MSQTFIVSVARRLNRSFVKSIAIVLLLSGLALLSAEFYHQRTQLIDRAHAFSSLTSPQLARMVSSDLPELANLLSDSYFSVPDLFGVYVYRNDGSQLVKLLKPGLNRSLPLPQYQASVQPEGSYETGFDLFQYRVPLSVTGQVVGQLYLQYSLDGVKKQLLLYTLFGSVIYGLSILGIYLLSKRQQRGVLEPVDKILNAIELITTEQNLSVKIPDDEKGELHDLISGFNLMLEQAYNNSLELKLHKKAIEQHVSVDPLTGLANRRLLMLSMEKAISRLKRSGQLGGLLYVGLDHFKTINDSLGHSVGDEVLKSVSSRIRNALGDADTPARLGGDEFIILLPELGKDESFASNNAFSVAEKVRQSIAAPYAMAGRRLHLTCSIGIALFDRDSTEPESLVMKADLAMCKAKAEGCNRVQFFIEEILEQTDQHQKIEDSLRTAIENDELYICYQPLVQGDGSIAGAEALVRWSDSENGLINPSAFIPIAERTDLICALGYWVLNEVCKQVAAWGAQGKQLVVSVNISPREFQQDDFVEKVQGIILNSGVRAEYLVFELTERVLLNDIERVRKTMQRLSYLGIRFALDDFGTGYSSLQSLKQLPLNTLKIDRSFVHQITAEADDAAVVSTIIAMAGTLGIDVVAEGVEKQGELDYLLKCGCKLFQGYYFSRPVKAKRMGSLIPAASPNQLGKEDLISIDEFRFDD